MFIASCTEVKFTVHYYFYTSVASYLILLKITRVIYVCGHGYPCIPKTWHNE